MANIEQIESALTYIHSDDRETWIQIGMALNSELSDTGFHIWDNWSQSADSYNQRDTESTWKSFSSGGGINIATLFHLAQQNGWTWTGAKPSEAEIAYQREELKVRNKQEAKRKVEEHQTAAKTARRLWAKGTTTPSKYFTRKQVEQVETVRTLSVDEVKKIIGYSPRTSNKKHTDEPHLEGQITLIPIVIDGKISTIEMIDQKGRKSAIKGGKKSGGFWATQPLPKTDNNNQTFLVGEGTATVMSCQRATGYLAIAALNCHNLLPVAELIRKRHPRSKIIIVSDQGNGEKDAEKAALTVGGLLAKPSIPEGDVGSDFNDLYQSKGPEEVKRQIEMSAKPNSTAADLCNRDTPTPLPDSLSPVAEFDDRLLPDKLRPLVCDAAYLMQCPPDFIAVGVMVSLASIIGRKISIRPQQNTDWAITPNLWGMVIGRPGVMKSPALEMASSNIKKLGAEAQSVFEQEMGDFQQTALIEKMRREASEKVARKTLSDDPSADLSAVLTIGQTEEPRLMRYMVNDTSPAALGELLRQNHNGLMVYRDELVSLLKGLDREDQAEGRGFYLTGWNGDSSYTFDRIGRGFNLYIPAVCLSLLGGTQPGKLSEYIHHAVNGGSGDDGLIQRFGLMVWPDNGDWKDVDRPPDVDAKREATKVFDHLNTLDPFAVGAEQDHDFSGNPEGVPYLRFDAGGHELFLEWRCDLESRLRSNELHPALESHLAKYRKLVPALALIIHLADMNTGPVTEDATLKALAWSDYLESHARRAYGSVTQAETSKAKKILNHIRKGDLPDEFSSRDIWRQGWSQLAESKKVGQALDLLVDYGWLNKIENPSTGGRPSTRFIVNPLAKDAA